MTLGHIATLRAIQGARFNFSNEAELQQGIADVLAAQEIAFEREVRMGKRDRIDFMVVGGTGIEVKVGGPTSAVIRQMFRYAECPQIERLILVTACERHRGVPGIINDKPVHVLLLPVAFQ